MDLNTALYSRRSIRSFSDKPVSPSAVKTDYSKTEYEVRQRGKRVAIIALGGFLQLGVQTVKLYEEKTGEKATLINPRFITGYDSDTLNGLKKDHEIVVTLEDGILSGGFGQRISAFYSDSSMKVLSYGFSSDIPHSYEPHELMERNRLAAPCIIEDVLKII